uniref:Uncharacterized protein n=1 Tax=Romanomermis culicivorax TaxID=13658 RepID=A0A915IYU0_ROMCU
MHGTAHSSQKCTEKLDEVSKLVSIGGENLSNKSISLTIILSALVYLLTIIVYSNQNYILNKLTSNEKATRSDHWSF